MLIEEESRVSQNGAHPDIARPEGPYQTDFLQRHGALANSQGEVEYHYPSLPSDTPTPAEVKAVVDKMADCLIKNEHPYHATDLQWRYTAKVRPAIDERTRLGAKVQLDLDKRTAAWEQKITDLDGNRSDAETTLKDKNAEFAHAQANAGITLPPETPISPYNVEEAIRETGPDEQHLAGTARARPALHSIPHPVLVALKNGFRLLPAVIFPFCFGALTHLIPVRELQRGDNLQLLLFCSAVGFSLLYSMGIGVHATVRAWGHVSEPCDTDAVPRYKHLLAAISLTVFLLTLCLAEITVEAVGIQELSQAFQASGSALQFGGNSGSLPLLLYYLIATLVSMPYLVAETGLAWIDQEETLRRAWQATMQRDWLKETMLDPIIQNLIMKAAHVEQAEANLKQIADQLEALRSAKPQLDEDTRRAMTSAVAAEAGEIASLHGRMLQLTESFETLPVRAEETRQTKEQSIPKWLRRSAQQQGNPNA